MTQAFTGETFKTYIGAYGGTDTRVDRSLPVRLTDVVNVKDWGATGDGVIVSGAVTGTDDGPALMAAIDYANSLGRVSHRGATVFFPPGIYKITSTLAINGEISFKGAGRDASIIRGNYDFTGAQQEEIPDSFLVRCGLTGTVRDLTIWNESTAPTSGALFMDAGVNNSYFENLHLVGMTGYACSELCFGARLTDCILTCSKSPTLASASNRSPLFTTAKFATGYKASGGCTMSGSSVAGFVGIATRDMGNNLIDAARGVGFTPNHSFNLVFLLPDGSNDNSTVDRAVAHAVSNSSGVITTADIVLDHAGSGYTFTPIYTINHSNIFGGVGAYCGQTFISNCHATGFDIGFSIIGGAISVKCCSATQCGVGFVCAFRNGSNISGSLDATVNPGDWYFLNAGDLMSCVIDRCTIGIYCYSAHGMFAANCIKGTTGPYIPAAIASLGYSGTTVTITTVDNHNLTGPLNIVTLQISPVTRTDDPDGFVTATITGAKTFTYTKAATTSFIAGSTWNYPLEYGVYSITNTGSWWVANTITASVKTASFAAEGGAEGNTVWSTRGEYGWALPQNNVAPFAAGLWDFDQCGGEITHNRPSTAQFPAVPHIIWFPGQQYNIPGSALTGAEINVISGAAALSFDDAVYAFLDLSVVSAPSDTTLTFASVPSSVISGMAVSLWGPPNTSLGTVNGAPSATVVTLSGTAGFSLPIGYRINFSRLGSTHYKTRFDGAAWKRIA